MYNNITINDVTAKHPTSATLPGDVIMFIGTSIKQPIGTSSLMGSCSQAIELFGGLPIDPSRIATSALSKSQKTNYMNVLNKNLAYNMQLFKKLLSTKLDPTVVVVRVGDYVHAKLSLKENLQVSGVGTNFFKPTKGTMAENSLKFEAVDGGDEANQFQVKIDTLQDGTKIASQLSVRYKEPMTGDFSTLTSISDDKIKNNTYTIYDINLLTPSQLAAKFNLPSNPFSSYLRLSYTPVTVKKSGITYNPTVNKLVQFEPSEEGAYRLSKINEINLTSTDTNMTFETGNLFTFDKVISKPDEAKSEYIKKPRLTYTTSLSTDPDNLDKTFTTIPTDFSSTIAGADPDFFPAKTYKYKLTPGYEMFWDKDIKTHYVTKYGADDVLTDTLKKYVAVEESNGVKWLHISQAVVEGTTKPVIVADTVTAGGVIRLHVEDVTGAETPLENFDPVIKVAYMSENGYEESDEFAVDVNGKKLTLELNLDDNGMFKVSELLKEVHVIGYKNGTPFDLGKIEMDFVLNKATFKPKGGNNKLEIQGTVADPQYWSNIISGKMPYTRLAVESFMFIQELTPKLLVVSEDRLSEWNTYYVSGKSITFGDNIPTNFTLTGDLVFKHRLVENIDYTVISNGVNPSDEDDTITILLKPEGSEQMASIAQGTLAMIYEVEPAMPAGTNNVWKSLEGGVESNQLTDSEYLAMVVDALQNEAPKYKPTQIYVCGLAADFHEEVFNADTGEVEKVALNAKKVVGEIVDTLNNKFPTSLRMDFCRHTITDVYDKEAREQIKMFEESYKVINSSDPLSFSSLLGVYSTPNLRIVSDLMVYQSTTTVSGSFTNYTIPYPVSLLSLKAAVLQDFSVERTHEDFTEVPSNIYSLTKVNPDIKTYANAMGVEVYSNIVHANSAAMKIMCVADPTARIRENGVEAGRDNQMVDDITKKALKEAEYYILKNVKSSTGVDATVLTNHGIQIAKAITDAFVNVKVFNRVNASISFANKAAMIAGLASLTLDLNLKPTIREIDVTVNLDIATS